MEVLLNDSSVLLNLLAADCLAQIAVDTGWQFAICPAVRDEVKKLRDFQTGEMVEIDLVSYIASGLLLVLDVFGENEETLLRHRPPPTLLCCGPGINAPCKAYAQPVYELGIPMPGDNIPP
ncbi:MAG: hypothetical protein ABI615_10390 [Chthoniobacterales bacterium]